MKKKEVKIQGTKFEATLMYKSLQLSLLERIRIHLIHRYSYNTMTTVTTLLAKAHQFYISAFRLHAAGTEFNTTIWCSV